MTTEHIATAFEFALRSTSDGIFIADADGVIQRVNPAAGVVLALNVEEIIGYTAREAFKDNPPLIRLFSERGNYTTEVQLPGARLALGMATTVENGDRIVLLQDITERRGLEARRESLINTMTHDLRNPLSAMNGFVELIARVDTLTEQQQRFLTRIEQTANKLYDSIGTLVDLAWIESGMPLEHRPLRLSELIEHTVIQLTPLAHRQGVTIAVSVQNPMPTIMGDPQRLQMVVHNLLRNAILYSKSDGSIVIHAWADANIAYCSVADQGIGINEHELDLVFDRLYRSSEADVLEKPGGGLGLTIARTIIQRHGGDITVSSIVHEGSTFTFTLPIVEHE
ncbi:MAG: PAS domain-containing protein [Chloroflexi bacterium]|nr:MAG: hypothetical protein CUN54_04945 [Phototrophicales bacterium]RMF82490.1 MAG: PAS domain-containing protein [Chloroflexota bacterium]